jgi:protein arginine kinase
MKKSEQPFSLTELRSPWNNNENSIWLASTLRLLRNIDKFLFPHKLSSDKKKHILALISKAFSEVSTLKNPHILKAEETTSAQREFLIEHFLVTEGFHESSPGAGFGFDETGEIFALFNCKDHVLLQCTDCTGNLEKAWDRLLAIETEMQKSINFAFSPKFGFLTVDPMQCGTAFFLSAYLHLPALLLTNTFLDHAGKERAEGVEFFGIQGSPDEFLGDIVVVKNCYSLGLNEQTILSMLRNAILRFVIAEKDARSHLQVQMKDLFKDRISKAVGILKYSYKLDSLEALQAVSLVKLGIELGWVEGVSIRQINSLFMDCRRIHLTYLLSEVNPTEEISLKRADFVKKVLEPLVLQLK